MRSREIAPLEPMQCRFIVTGQPGRDGKQSFDIEWRAAGGKYRGQCFHADLQAHKDQMRENGFTVIDE